MRAWEALYKAGERGRNRVVLVRRSDRLALVWHEGARRVVRAIGHRDVQRGKAEADVQAAQLGTRRPARGEPLTLAALFDNYLRVRTPEKASPTHDHRTARLILECLGSGLRVQELEERHVNQYVVWRKRTGGLREGRARGTAITNRTVVRDLNTLKAACAWAVEEKLLDTQPLRRKWFPPENVPRRPIVTPEQFAALCRVAPEVHPAAYTLLVAVYETGHRIGAVRQLRWSDVDLTLQRVQWRSETEKTDRAHATPLSETAVQALKEWRCASGAIGDAPVFAGARRVDQPMTASYVRDLWEKLSARAGLPAERHRGWHSLRRAFANQLREVPLRDLAALGGWARAETVLNVYQSASDDTMRKALARRLA